MRAQGCWTLIVLLAASANGCGWKSDGRQAASGGSVAVIDLDEIARRLGSDKQIADAVAQRQTALSQHLVDLAKSYSEQIAAQKKTLPSEPTQQSDVTLASWQQQANANLNQVKQQAEADLYNHRLQLVQKFRDQIKPVARRVAQERGLTVIVTKNDSVVYDFTATADITSAVVDELLASSAAVPAAQVSTASAPAQSIPQQAAVPSDVRK